MTINSEDKYLTLSEVKDILRVSKPTIIKYIRRKENPLIAMNLKGNINKSKYNRQEWRVKESDLANFIILCENRKEKASKE